MGFKMKGFPKPFKKTQKSSFRQTSEGYSDIDEDAYYLGKDELGETPDTPEVSNEEYWNTKKNQEQRRDAIENTKTTGGRVLDAMMTLPGFSHINYLRMHKKWAKFHNGFGGPGGVRQIPADASPEQRVQKMIGDELILRADRQVIDAYQGMGMGTQAGLGAQGVNLENIYNSASFQSYMKKVLNELEMDGGDPNKVQTNLWEGWDYPMGKSHFKGGIITGDDITNGGISKERDAWRNDKQFRGPTATELKQWENRTGTYHPDDPNKTKKEIAAFLGSDSPASDEQKEEVQEYLDSEEGDDIT